MARQLESMPNHSLGLGPRGQHLYLAAPLGALHHGPRALVGRSDDGTGNLNDSDDGSTVADAQTCDREGADADVSDGHEENDHEADLVKIPVDAVPAYIDRVGDELAVENVSQRRRGSMSSFVGDRTQPPPAHAVLHGPVSAPNVMNFLTAGERADQR
jgi:hypothetical protein